MECVGEETFRTAQCHIHRNSSPFNSDEVCRTDGYEHHGLAIQTAEVEYHAAVSSTLQPGIHRQQMTLDLESLHKTCHWFDDIEAPADTHAALFSSQTNRSTRLLKKIYRQVSLTAVCSLTVQVTEESEFHFTPSESSTASHNPSRTVIEVCFPPGYIPSNTIVQVTRERSQSEAKAKATIKQNDGLELNLWIEDICNQALTFENFSRPGIICAPCVAVVHDLEEETSPEESHLACSMFKSFLENKIAPHRRNATCEEIELTTSFVKINGAKFSLWHLRNQLIKVRKLRKR